MRFADRVEQIIASTDCGFGLRIHPQLGWAKPEALTEGARLANSEPRTRGRFQVLRGEPGRRQPDSHLKEKEP